MKIISWKRSGSLVLALGLLAAAVWVVFFRSAAPDLAQANCRPVDLGERYRDSGRAAELTIPDLDWGEVIVESSTVELVDLQLSNTVLGCTIVQFGDQAAARRAFEGVCGSQSGRLVSPVGEEACDFAGSAPQNLAFRRGVYLVLMSGDLSFFPAAAVDERLR